MNILIVTNFCGNLDTINNDRFLYLANILSKEHNVEVVTSDFFHTEKKKRNCSVNFNFKITFLTEPVYKRNVCLKRFFSHYIWGKNVGKYLKKISKPDVIYCAIPSLTAAYYTAKFCKKNKIKYVIDIQDLWPEAFQMIFRIPIVSSIIFLPFRLLANKIYSYADSICAVSQTYAERGLSVNTKCKNSLSVFLGTNLQSFHENVIKNESCVNKNDNSFKIAYCGTLGSSYNLPIVFDALYLLKQENLEPLFIIMGSGPRENEFKEYAANLNINTKFLGRLSYDKMCAVVSSCNIAVNPIAKNAAQSIINKHADYAASGLPVINTQTCKEYRDLISNYNMGRNCENANDIAFVIKELMNNPYLCKELSQNARRCAEEKFDRTKTYQLLIEEIVK